MSGPALDTTYLGLHLRHPFMVGASPLADDVDSARRLEDGGSSAIVLRSLFEEQITQAQTGRIHQIDPFDPAFALRVSAFPSEDRYRFKPDEYLEHIRRVKAAVAVPVIASLNGMTAELWLQFARQIQDAGADALEINIFRLVTDVDHSSLAIESQIRNIVVELKRALRIPVALKLLPFYTAFGHFARQMDAAGVDGLVMFNRFYEPDIDVRTMAPWPHVELSLPGELLLRLRWAAVLHSRVRCSLAVTGGVSSPTDGVKAILAGAHAVQLVSAVLRNGPAWIGEMRDGLERWLDANHLRLAEARGRLDGAEESELAERASYIRTLQSWNMP